MSRVADDFAAIAQRLKEIQAEVAKEREAAEARRNTNGEAQPELANSARRHERLRLTQAQWRANTGNCRHNASAPRSPAITVSAPSWGATKTQEFGGK